MDYLSLLMGPVEQAEEQVVLVPTTFGSEPTTGGQTLRLGSGRCSVKVWTGQPRSVCSNQPIRPPPSDDTNVGFSQRWCWNCSFRRGHRACLFIYFPFLGRLYSGTKTGSVNRRQLQRSIRCRISAEKKKGLKNSIFPQFKNNGLVFLTASLNIIHPK